MALDDLTISLTGDNSSAVNSLDGVISALDKLRTAASVSGLSETAASLTAISQASLQLGESTPIVTLADSLARLKEVGNIKMTGTVNQLNKLVEVSGLLKTSMTDSGFATNIKSVADALKPLSELGKSNLGSTLNALQKLPEVFATLKTVDMSSLGSTVSELATALNPLADKMNAISSGFSALPQKVNKLASGFRQAGASQDSYKNSTKGLIDMLGTFRAKALIVLFVFRKLRNIFGSLTSASNAYVENLNLFNVSMGEFADEATKHMNRVTEALGLSKSEWMANQAVFQQMATGFGISGEKAEIMSRNLTQLGYDLSSYFNVDIDTAMQKLQSGLSGQIKGLKAFGINVSNAAIQETALAYGVNHTTSEMSEAEKAMWRYVTIIERSRNAQGDLARTLVTPANAMRVFGQQVNILKTQLGNLVTILLAKIIPVIQLFVQAISKAVGWLAGLLGFKLPEIDYSGMSAGMKDVANSAKDAGGGAGKLANGTNRAAKNTKKTKEEIKKLKKELLGFDEINLLSFSRNKPNNDKGNSSGGSGGGGGGGGGASGGGSGALPDIKLPEYDMLKGLQDQFSGLKKEMADLFAPVKKSWDTYGEAVAYSIQTKYKVIKDVLRGVYDSFKKAWTGGRGERITNNILNIIIHINEMVSSLGIAFLQAWKHAGNGDRIMDSLLKIFESLTFYARKVTGGIRDIIRNADLKPLMGAFADLSESVANLADSGMRTLTDIFLKVAKAVVFLATKALPPLLEVLSKVADWFAKHPYLFLGFAGTAKVAGIGLGVVKGKIGELVAKNSLPMLASVLETVKGNLKPLAGMAMDFVKEFTPLGGVIESLGSMSGLTILSAGLIMATPLMAGLYLKSRAAKTEVGQLGKKWKDLDTRRKDLKVMYAMETDPKKKKALEKEIQILSKKEIDIKAQIKLKQGQKAKETKKITKIADSYKAKIPMDMQLRQGSIKGSVKKTRDEARKIAQGKPIELSTKLSDIKDKLSGTYDKAVKWCKEKPITWLQDAGVYGATLGKGLKEMKKKASGWIKSNPLKWKNQLAQKIGWLKEQAQKARKSAQDWIKDHLPRFSFSVPSATDLYNKLKKVISDAKAKVKKKLSAITLNFKVKMDSLKDWINTKIIRPLNNGIAKVPGLKKVVHIPELRAEGGYVNTGQMFIAREAGPEMVGTIGNKTAVANNSQIVTAVSEGVKNALLSVMSTDSGQSSGSQTINLVVDGEVLAKVVNNYNSGQQLRYGV